MEISTAIEGASATMALVGKLTVATAPRLEAAFAELPEGITDVVLDLSALDYVASAGLRVVVSRDKALRKSGGNLRLVHPNEEVMDVFDTTGLVDILAIER